MAEKPMIRLSVQDENEQQKVPADVRTRAEAVETDETGKTVQDKLTEYDAHVANKAIHSDAYIRTMLQVTIPATGWVAAEPEDVEFPYCVEVDCDGVLDTHDAELKVERKSLAAAYACGLCPTGETMHNKVKFWARKIPTAAILCHMTLFGGGGVSGGDTSGSETDSDAEGSDT